MDGSKREPGQGQGGGLLRRIAGAVLGDRRRRQPPDLPGRAPAVDVAAGAGDVCERLREWVCEISPKKRFVPAALDPDQAIFDAGYVDSMSYVELLARVESQYGVTVPDEQVIGTSLNRLAGYVASQLARAPDPDHGP